jgi:predicted CopG family antitoxin
MGLSSIQVSEETRERLRRYKTEGMSYEDVLRLMMDLLGPDEFHALYKGWQARVAQEIRKSKKWDRLRV